MPDARVLLVEDNPGWIDTVITLLQHESCQLMFARNGPEADRLLKEHSFHLVITNMILKVGSPLLEGLLVLDHIRALGGATQCIVLTDCDSFAAAAKIHYKYRDFVHAILPKSNPWVEQDEFLRVFREALSILLPHGKRAKRVHPSEASALIHEPGRSCQQDGSPRPPKGRQITWLHISDLHFKPDDPSYTQAKIVLGELVKDVKKLKKEHNLRFSFVVVTGDVAYSGIKPQYAAAASFFDDLLEAAGIDKEHLFIVPGNHDLRWDLINKIHANGIVTTLTSKEAVDELLGQPAEMRKILKKFKGYAKFTGSYLVDTSGNKLRPFHDYLLSYTETEPYAGKRVRILGLNSAWMSAYNWKPDKYKEEADDEGNLILGRTQLRHALNLTEGEEQPDLTIALMHHPWSDFKEDVDGQEVRGLQLKSCDFVLRGHLHDTDLMEVGTPDGTATVITAGLGFKSKKKKKEYYGYNVVKLDLTAGYGTVFLRCFSGKTTQFWAADTQTYEMAPEGRYTIKLPSSLT